MFTSSPALGERFCAKNPVLTDFEQPLTFACCMYPGLGGSCSRGLCSRGACSRGRKPVATIYIKAWHEIKTRELPTISVFHSPWLTVFHALGLLPSPEAEWWFNPGEWRYKEWGEQCKGLHSPGKPMQPGQTAVKHCMWFPSCSGMLVCPAICIVKMLIDVVLSKTTLLGETVHLRIGSTAPGPFSFKHNTKQGMFSYIWE